MSGEFGGRRRRSLSTTEETMAFFRRTTTTEPYSTLGSNDTLPATTSSSMANWKDRIAQGGNAALGKATQVYRENPKLIGGLAVLAGAAILAGMKKRGSL
jgi:hypothetical protein